MSKVGLSFNKLPSHVNYYRRTELKIKLSLSKEKYILLPNTKRRRRTKRTTKNLLQLFHASEIKYRDETFRSISKVSSGQNGI